MTKTTFKNFTETFPVTAPDIGIHVRHVGKTRSKPSPATPPRPPRKLFRVRRNTLVNGLKSL